MNTDRNSLEKFSLMKPILLTSRLIPRRFALKIASLVGTIMFFAMKRVRRVVFENLRVVVGVETNKYKIKRLGLNTFRNYAKFLVDYMYLSHLPKRKIFNMVSNSRGKRFVDKSLQKGRGTILITAHLGLWELGGIFLRSKNYPFNVMTLFAMDKRMDKFRENIRKRFKINSLYLDQSKGSILSMVEVINFLRENEIVAMLSDRRSSENLVEIDFFGRKVRIPSGPAILSFVTGAPIIPAFTVLEDDKNYFAVVEEPIILNKKKERSEAIEEGMQKIANVFEKYIREFPDQWYNFYPFWRE